VKSGQVIALMGRGPGDRPLLHFEIRRDGKPIDPVGYLPARQGP
jgi:lipoprotein NlpD